MRVALNLAGLVLRNAPLDLIGMAEVVAAIGAAQHINEEGLQSDTRPFDKLRANRVGCLTR